MATSICYHFAGSTLFFTVKNLPTRLIKVPLLQTNPPSTKYTPIAPMSARQVLRKASYTHIPRSPLVQAKSRTYHSSTRLLRPTIPYHTDDSSSSSSSSPQDSSFRALSSLPNPQIDHQIDQSHDSSSGSTQPHSTSHALSSFFAQLTQVQPPTSVASSQPRSEEYAARRLPMDVELFEQNTGERLETLGQAQEYYEQSGK